MIRILWFSILLNPLPIPSFMNLWLPLDVYLSEYFYFHFSIRISENPKYHVSARSRSRQKASSHQINLSGAIKMNVERIHSNNANLEKIIKNLIEIKIEKVIKELDDKESINTPHVNYKGSDLA